ncbi:hypothetical protein [Paenibacillus sp. NEAU-GSW1]|uniref:DUF6892 domain-containing protein n=1 Tax=Paenibacillus sp. NEAU-GSW1 TaxID=2682486 RepID=UPI0012E2BA1C|nr:hypothetical protein [Paenibacillus sp. NEAU-GSW1]MUT64721.1 hypothetical protein [Paenibacillus sp. NEAU-GSW1]
MYKIGGCSLWFFTRIYEWYSGKGPIDEMYAYIENLIIEQSDLDKITELCFDGGNEAYF